MTAGNGRSPRRRTPGGGTRRNTTGGRPRARRPQKSGGGFGGYIGMALLAVLVAAGYHYRDEIKSRIGMAVKEAEKAANRDSESPEVELEVITQTVVRDKDGNIKSVEREGVVSEPGSNGLAKLPDNKSPESILPVRGKDDARAREVFTEAKKDINEGRYNQAVQKLARTRTMMLGAGADKASRNYLAVAELFADVEKRNPPEVESAGRDLYEFHIKNMGRFRGVVEKEYGDSIKIKKDSGISVTLKREQVLERTPISSGKRKAELLQELADRKAITRPSGVGRWQLARFAFESDLRPQAVELLKEAWELDPNISKSVYEERAREVLRDWIYYMGAEIEHKAKSNFEELKKEYPASEALAMARNMLEEEKKAVAKETGVDVAAKVKAGKDDKGSASDKEDAELDRLLALAREGNPEPENNDTDKPAATAKIDKSTGGSLAAQAKRAYQNGVSLFAQGSSTSSLAEGRNLIYQATDELEKAVKLYGKLLDENPGNKEYEDGLSAAQRKLRWATNFRRVG